MGTGHVADEAEVRQQMDRLAQAIRAADLEGLRPLYAPDIVTFDVGPPLQRVGAEGKLQNWAEAFAIFQHPLGYEIRDLTLTLSDDVAFAHGFGRLSGTLKNGTSSSGFWVRYTVCFRKIAGSWLIVHDHASAPLDFESGSAVLNLEP